ncbi:MAG: MATE family efflux transporter [Prochlorothrix sp.]|nr:MATE family efflux transporter [Prochlorothrix sp.]
MSPYRTFIKLSAVNILSNFLVPLASLADTAFLGRWAAVEDLAGVALATVVFNYLYWTFGFLRMGTTGQTAQAIGRGDDREVGVILLRYGLVAIGVGSLIVVAQGPIGWLGFEVLRGSAGVELAGQAYYGGRIWGAPATLTNFVLWGWLLGQAEARGVLLLSALANGGNVVLDYGFVVLLGWGSGGAGLATALSQYLTLGVGGLWVWRRMGRSWVDRFWSDRSMGREVWQQVWDAGAIGHAFALNRDIVIRTFALVSVFALFTNFSAMIGAKQGQEVALLAANALLLQGVTLSAYFVDGLAFATESLVGQLAGQGNRAEIRRLLRWGIRWGLLFSGSFALILTVFPQVFGLLTNHGPVLALARALRGWLWPVLVVGSVAYLLDGYWLGLTQGGLLRRSSLWASGLFFLPLAIGAVELGSIELLWLALVMFMVGRVVTLGWPIGFDRG